MGAFFLFISLFVVLVAIGEAIREGLYKATDNPKFLPKPERKGGAKP